MTLNRPISFCLALLASTSTVLGDGNFPAPCPPREPAKLGRQLQRSLRLLGNSTPEHRNTVRVLFYGQSITEQAWWKNVADDLHSRFPSANLIVENRAIGGHSSQRLWKTAEADVYPFYPDLVIFHVYGSHLDYEKLIQGIRSRTVADVILQTDHITRDEALDEETDPAKLTPAQWDAWMNNAFLPATAGKYGCELADLHTGWKCYLRSNNLKAAQLLRDAVHLNAQGEYVMAEMVKPYLRFDPSAQPAPADVVRDFEVGRDLQWQDGKLTLEFEGNRIEALCAPGEAAPAEVLIDGKHPTECPACFTFTKTSGYLGTNWPCLLRVQSEGPLQEEEWTVTLGNASADYKSFDFKVSGSKSGADGEGKAGGRFVSNSKRIVIEPEDWNLAYCCEVFKKPLPPDFAITFKSIALCHDQFTSPGVPDPAVEVSVVLAQGMPNGKHKIEIRGDAGTPLRALRVSRPPWRQ